MVTVKKQEESFSETWARLSFFKKYILDDTLPITLVTWQFHLRSVLIMRPSNLALSTTSRSLLLIVTGAKERAFSSRSDSHLLEAW